MYIQIYVKQSMNFKFIQINNRMWNKSKIQNVQYKNIISILHAAFQYTIKFIIRGLLEKYPTFGREKETGLPGALDT